MSKIRVPGAWSALGRPGELLSHNCDAVLLLEPWPRQGLRPHLQVCWSELRQPCSVTARQLPGWECTPSPSLRMPRCRVQPGMSGAIAQLLPGTFHSAAATARPMKGGLRRLFLQTAQKTLSKLASERQAGIWVPDTCLHKGSQPSFS